MENLSWDGSTPSLWTESIQQHDQIEPASFINNSNSCSLFYGGRKVMDLASASAAAAADQTIFNNNPMIQNRFEKAHHQATHFINSKWEGNNDLCYVSDRPLIGLEEANLGMTNDKVQHFVSTTNGCGGGGVSTTTTTTGGSLDSLDCLMSAETTINNNSNTDTSDDDGISMILSAADCRNIWASFGGGGGGGAAVSSAESSENINGGCNNFNNLNTQKDEKNSSYHHQDDTKRPNSTTKRSSSLNKDRYNFDLLHQSSDYSCTTEGGFKLILEENNQPKPKKRPRSENRTNSLNINFQQQQQQPSNSSFSDDHQEPDTEAIAQMKEMIYRAAVFRPVDLEMEVKMEKPKRKNVRISSDPQTVAARQRRERISERIRVLQRLVPGGSKMDTASMLDEAANYLKFLRSQVKVLENVGHHKLDSSINSHPFSSMPFNNHSFPMQTHWPFSTAKP